MASKTVITQTTFHSNSRTEFRLHSDKKVLSSQLRICNFGVGTVTKVNNADPTPLYNLGTGIYGCIKQITLYSGSIILDELKDASRWLGLVNLAGQTDAAWDLKQKLVCSGLSLRHDEPIQSASLLELRPESSKYIGMINLQNVFPMLNAVGDYLIDFPDLRVVIEYNTDLAQIFQDLRAAGALNALRPASCTFNQPIMVHDELADEEMVAQMLSKGGQAAWQYLAIEREVINIAEPAANAGDFNSIRLRSMDQKMVNNVVLQVLPAGAADPQLGYAYSVNMPQGDDKFNFVLNSKRLLPQNGFSTPARKAAAVADTFPLGLNVFTLAHDVPSSTNNVYGQLFDANLQALFNKLAFVNCDLKDVVNQLDLEYSRVPIAQNPAVQIWVWSRVLKQGAKASDGTIVTQYSL